MKPGIIACAFISTVQRPPLRRTSQNTGHDYVTFEAAVQDGAQDPQRVDVACFGPAVDIAATLSEHDSVYIEGKLTMRTWPSADGGTRSQLSVVASLVQPLGKIGERRPKATRSTRKTAAPRRSSSTATSAAVHQPIPFNDELPI